MGEIICDGCGISIAGKAMGVEMKDPDGVMHAVVVHHRKDKKCLEPAIRKTLAKAMAAYKVRQTS